MRATRITDYFTVVKYLHSTPPSRSSQEQSGKRKRNPRPGRREHPIIIDENETPSSSAAPMSQSKDKEHVPSFSQTTPSSSQIEVGPSQCTASPTKKRRKCPAVLEAERQEKARRKADREAEQATKQAERAKKALEKQQRDARQIEWETWRNANYSKYRTFKAVEFSMKDHLYKNGVMQWFLLDQNDIEYLPQCKLPNHINPKYSDVTLFLKEDVQPMGYRKATILDGGWSSEELNNEQEDVILEYGRTVLDLALEELNVERNERAERRAEKRRERERERETSETGVKRTSPRKNAEVSANAHAVPSSSRQS